MTSGTRGNKRKVRSAVTILAAAVGGAMIFALAAPPASAYVRPGESHRVSLNEGGAQGEVSSLQGLLGTDARPQGTCWWDLGPPAMSQSGRFVAFASMLDGLAKGEAPVLSDVFLKDRKTGKVEVVSGTETGIPPIPLPQQDSNGLTVCSHTQTVIASHPSISGNGRWVSFVSSAVNLVPGDTNLAGDVFLHDRKRKVTVRVSIGDSGSEANGHSGSRGYGPAPVVSDDGRYVSFQSIADNLVSGDTNDVSDVFVRDLQKRRTIRASVGNDGEEAARGGRDFAMTPDAHLIAFSSSDPTLGREDQTSTPTNLQKAIGSFFVYIRNLEKGTTEVGPLAIDGTGQDGAISSSRAISENGRFIAFSTAAPDSVPNDRNAFFPGVDGGEDQFVFDRVTGRTERVSVQHTGEEVGHQPYHGYSPTLSSNGRFAVLASGAAEFSRPTADQEYEVCVEEESDGGNPFTTCGGDYDVFVHDRKTGAMLRASLGEDETDLKCPPSPSAPVFEARGYCGAVSPAIRNGREVVFMSYAENIVVDDTNDAMDVFVRDMGPDLGVGGFGGSPSREDEPPPDDGICVTPDLCIPPGAAFSSSDDVDDLNDALTEQGANLYGASVAYRPQYSDLFVKIELEHMPKVVPGMSPIFYGLRFKSGAKSYEVRATSLNHGTFGLFDCTGSRPLCTGIADLRGGYGTTGMRVVFSLPLHEIRLEHGGELKDVTAFSGLGNYLTGAGTVLDELRIR